MPYKVKICGIKSIKVAQIATLAGADFLGFNFVPTSLRVISPLIAQKIIQSLPKKQKPICVGVFMDQSPAQVQKILKQIQLDMLQFHGQETPSFCASFKLPYIKTFTFGKKTSVTQISKHMKLYKPACFLLDREQQGTGTLLDLKKVKHLAKKFPIILAGGLTEKNLKSIISLVKGIIGFDVAGGVETKGKKDLAKIKKFLLLSKLSS